MKPCKQDDNENEQIVSRQSMLNERVSRERLPKEYVHVTFVGRDISARQKRIYST